MPPGAEAFRAGDVYSHGGLSPQECVTPDITLGGSGANPGTAAAKIVCAVETPTAAWPYARACARPAPRIMAALSQSRKYHKGASPVANNRQSPFKAGL